MPRSATEILAPARTELARGRPRAALKELESARVELAAARDAAGLGEALELARKVPTLAPVDTRSRERLVAAIEQDVTSLGPSAIAQPAAAATPSAVATTAAATPGAPASAPALYTSYASTQREKILASPRAEIERGETKRALHSLEKARRKLLERGDAAGLGELLDLAQRMSTTKARHEKARRLLIDAAQQNVRYIGRRNALKAGEEWSDPFAAAQSKPALRLPSLPPMSRREILTAACIVVVFAGAISAWALVKRAPQRVAHAIACPTGDEGSRPGRPMANGSPSPRTEAVARRSSSSRPRAVARAR
jgi:hypothetical protein